MLRGNADIIVLQPIFQHEARLVLADLYGGWMPHKDFFCLMDEVVFDRNLPGSTPQDPKKEVRTMIINDFENTTNVQMKFKWHQSEDPGKFKMLPQKYWDADKKLRKKPRKVWGDTGGGSMKPEEMLVKLQTQAAKSSLY